MRRESIEDALLKIGVPVEIRGFTSIVDAIEMFDKKGQDVSITKEMYPAIAEKRGTKPSMVRRDIRRALDITRKFSKYWESVRRYIGLSNQKNSSSLKHLYVMLKREES